MSDMERDEGEWMLGGNHPDSDPKLMADAELAEWRELAPKMGLHALLSHIDAQAQQIADLTSRCEDLEVYNRRLDEALKDNSAINRYIDKNRDLTADRDAARAECERLKKLCGDYAVEVVEQAATIARMREVAETAKKLAGFVRNWLADGYNASLISPPRPPDIHAVIETMRTLEAAARAALEGTP